MSRDFFISWGEAAFVHSPQTVDASRESGFAYDEFASEGAQTAKDPIGFAGGDTNLLAYVGGDPVNNIDPVGLDITNVISNRAAGIPEGRMQGEVSQTAGVDISVRVGFGPAISAKYNSKKGLTYAGVGIGVGMSCNISGAGIEGTAGSGAKGIVVEGNGSIGTGTVGITGSTAVGVGGSTTSVKPGIGIGSSVSGTIGYRW